MYKAIIVDDEPQMLRGLRTQIEWENNNLELIGTALSGQEALELMKQNPDVHLLITDVSMPSMDGLELITLAKAINRSLRCIIISAYNEFDYVKKALQLGVENYLLKPINENELHETLYKTLENLERDQLASSFISNDLTGFRANILDRWVNGTIQDFELLERAELLHINLHAQEYLVFVVDIVQNELTIDPIKTSNIVLKVFTEILFPKYQGECFIDGKLRVVYILSGSFFLSRQKEIEMHIKEATVKAAKKGVKTFTSISPISPSYSKVKESYASACLYLFYNYIDPADYYIFCHHSSNLLQKSPQKQSQNILMMFSNSIQKGDAGQAELMIRTYLNLNTKVLLDVLKQEMLPFILILLKIITETGKVSSSLPENIKNQLSKWNAISTYQKLEYWFIQIIHQSVEEIHVRKDSFHLLVHRTLEYVHEHYNKDLSLKTLSIALNVNSAYLGRLFKDETGKYFNDYLTEYRLQTAKVLLLETDMKIGEIINWVGINNQSYFNRIFKKVYGMTPLEFRRKSK